MRDFLEGLIITVTISGAMILLMDSFDAPPRYVFILMLASIIADQIRKDA